MAYTTIKKPSDYFNTKLYTGNDGTLAISGVGFQPDWTWIKCRSHGGSASFEHVLTDAVRGVNKTLVSNDTDAETTNNATGYLSVFGSDGFTVTGGDAVNGVGRTYASWNWLGANGTASNTDGSITSTVSANTTSGFSIVSYAGNGTAGATIGHSLGIKPSCILVKNRDNNDSWRMYHTSLGATKFLTLNSTNAAGTNSAEWNNTEPTSSVFTVGSGTNTNTNTQDYIAYCFAEVKGFSKFGSYVGNGNADGTFVYTGFKPAFVIIRRTDTAENWTLFDNKRDVDNVAEHLIRPDTTAAEEIVSNYRLDLLSNGFKLKTTDGKMNASGGTYIYMAFAEEPLVGDNPATAR